MKGLIVKNKCIKPGHKGKCMKNCFKVEEAELEKYKNFNWK